MKSPWHWLPRWVTYWLGLYHIVTSVLWHQISFDFLKFPSSNTPQIECTIHNLKLTTVISAYWQNKTLKTKSLNFTGQAAGYPNYSLLFLTLGQGMAYTPSLSHFLQYLVMPLKEDSLYSRICLLKSPLHVSCCLHPLWSLQKVWVLRL